ncbi:hypothetical protein pdam_00011795 [Pocillopora damicornis]|uniref:Uncharacterized protein n=1 Tax=Pocillopora damicornis TaxID=46731 RepID=A0A3M6U2Q8_POCDA|nr:hypothetical protein pdam_00011795 [Pocillopora damicornis]
MTAIAVEKETRSLESSGRSINVWSHEERLGGRFKKTQGFFF